MDDIISLMGTVEALCYIFNENHRCMML